ncbi:hypothetical protein GCM10008961_13340 [Deinococcus knuensis]|uniref:Uncharacterized protein n=1 Tax=Deinococcus knuensis TaxID=1837380 RepID=A0ABQ2SDT1_9DEIO|nr:hypothetical protein GCM10008961_13340 [Deinococcus knuensis]
MKPRVASVTTRRASGVRGAFPVRSGAGVGALGACVMGFLLRVWGALYAGEGVTGWDRGGVGLSGVGLSSVGLSGVQ